MLTLLHQAIVAIPLLILIVVLGWTTPRLGAGMFRRVESTLAWLGRRPHLALAAIAPVGLLTAASVSWCIGIPQPSVHDEFSYLLAADTFAHGRLANPPHPMWVHFESFHILQQPTYASKYPPGEGLMLAAGQICFHLPIAGVWLTMGLTCAAICWMLQAWMPARWAVLGGILACINLALLESCGTYWGGNMAALGGVLTLGGFRWTTRQPRPGNALLLGGGIAVLAVTRPYEGFVLALMVLVALAVWAFRQNRWRELAGTVALPLGSILLLTFAAIGFYNRSVTGSPFRLPYTVHESTYAVAPVFLVQRPLPIPHYNHAVMREFHLGQAMAPYNRQRSPRGFVEGALGKLGDIAVWYLRPLLLGLPLATLPWMLKRDPWMRLAGWIYAVFSLALLAETYWSPHYFTPILSVIWLFVLQSMRHMHAWRLAGKPSGRFLVRAVLILCIFSWGKWYRDFARLERKPLGAARAQILARLERVPGDHLVLVSYRPGHDPNAEWVYNRADIDNSRVVWARAMGDAKDSELRAYYASRRVWRLDADAAPPQLTPESSGDGQTDTMTARPK